MLFSKLIQIVDSNRHSAAMNMAIDEVLLRSAVEEPMLRIYHWERPAVSFGYFGSWQDTITLWPQRDVVRRWTGGGVVLHGEDLTYTLVVPRAHRFFREPPLASYEAVHATIAALLENASLASDAVSRISSACFENAVRYDVVLGGKKVAGAAQRRTRSGLLHQGSIQAGQDTNLETLLPLALGKEVERIALTSAALESAVRLAEDRYASPAWLRRV